MLDIRRVRNVDAIAPLWLARVNDFFLTSHNHRLYIETPYGTRMVFDTYAEKLFYQCFQEVINIAGGVYDRNKSRRQYQNHRNVCARYLMILWARRDSIILASPDYMRQCVQNWSLKKGKGVRLIDALKDILVSYYELVSNTVGGWLVAALNIQTCPYCNRQFIYVYTGASKERPELDHFYSKSEFPLFCLSFYNLIPACHSCNHLKSANQLKVHPYQRAFSNKFVFVDGADNLLTKPKIYRLTEKEIRLKLHGKYADENEDSKILGLEDVYNKHSNYVKEIIDKSMAYDKYVYNALVTSFQGAGYHPRQVYDFVWGRKLMEPLYEDRPLSKLTKDILDVLDIKRR